MTGSFRITVDGNPVETSAGESLLDAARRAGAQIPSLCHHRLLKPYGACRLCLVEVTRGGRTRLTTSCNYEVLPDIEVRTDSEDIRRHRRMVLQLLLGLAPDAAAVKGLARAAGATEAAFRPAPAPAGRKDCIVCGLCARICAEVVGAAAITLSGRGERKGLEVPFRERIADSCIGCGACAAVCPTDAISMEDIAVALLRRRPATDRPCRHALMGAMPGAICPNDYDCARCEVDQRFVEACRPEHPIFAARGLTRPAGWEE
ncbi:MAG TPA: 2Fe-2S iron-sulfur cluster-binding protein [Polyangia bacterium]|nr:2Fe-2S iron-sulfur cluster-binding protein [Polyangia bacterium]